MRCHSSPGQRIFIYRGKRRHVVSDRIFCDKSGVPFGDRPLLKEPPVSDRLSGGAYRAHDAFGGTADTASVESGSRVCGNDFYDCRYTASESRFL